MIRTRAWLEYFLRLAWVRGKAALGLPVRGDKNLFAADAAWRLRTGRLPKGAAITCSGRNDGVGMQAMARISTFNFAAAFGATYVHSPFERLDHSDRDMAAWVAAWEELFGLGKGEVAIADGNFEVIDYADYFFGRRQLSPSTVLNLQQCFWLQRTTPESYQATIPHLRAKYGFVPHRRDGQAIVVAVHVRRGDVTAQRNSARYTGDAAILASIARLRQVLDQRAIAYRLCLHSEGAAKDFQVFSEAGCALHLNEDALSTMRQLIEADILLTSKSSFSYVAALINDGIKIYEPCENGPLSDWIVRAPDGSFDTAALTRKLDLMTSRAMAEMA